MAAAPTWILNLAKSLEISGKAGQAVAPLMTDGGCGIEVYNQTKFVLSDIIVHVEQGDISLPPEPVVPPFHHAVMVARKPLILPLGTYGTMSWLVNGCEGAQPDRRVYIMWSAPCALGTYANTLGVGLSTPGHVDHPKDKLLFQQMYKGCNSDSLKCEKRKYKKNVEAVVCRDDRLQVYGTMNTTSKAVAIIIICPLQVEDFAIPIKMSSTVRLPT